jgi:ATP-dependent DNA helicase RecG
MLQALLAAMQEVVLVTPDNDSSAPSRHQVGTKLKLSTDQLLVFEQIEGEMSLVELMVLLNRKDRTKFRQQVLTPLIDLGLVEANIPDKPTSSRQKYRLKREDD